MSPITMCGILDVVGDHPPRAVDPATLVLDTLIALSSRPSANVSAASTIPQVPGVSAPRSRWWAVVTEKPASSPSTKTGTAKATSGRWRRAVVGMVVHDHVARAPLVPDLGEASRDPGQVARDRSRLQRGRLRGLAQLAALVIADRAAEVLGLADDRGVSHAGQAVAHLDGDRSQAPPITAAVIGSMPVLDGAEPDAVMSGLVKPFLLGLPTGSSGRCRSRSPAIPVARRSSCRAGRSPPGPGKSCSGGSASRSRSRRCGGPARRRRGTSPRGVTPIIVGVEAAALHLQRCSGGPIPERRHPQVDDLDRVLARAPVLALVQLGGSPRVSARRSARRPAADPQLVALAARSGSRGWRWIVDLSGGGPSPAQRLVSSAASSSNSRFERRRRRSALAALRTRSASCRSAGHR